MTNCPVCETPTAPVKIGGLVYCSQCGTALGNPTPPPPPQRSLDLSPRNHTNAVHTRSETGAPAVPVIAAAAPAPPQADRQRPAQAVVARPAGHAAAEMHRRTKTSKVLDLRNTEPKPVAPEPALNAAQHHTPAAPPKSTTHERHLAHFTDRFEKAREVHRSPHIQKFSERRLQAQTAAAHTDTHGPWVVDHKTTPVEHRQTGPHPAGLTAAPARELPAQVAAQHQALTRLAPTPPPSTRMAPAPKSAAGWRPHLGLSQSGSRTLATVSAIVLMGSYIWLENYPKLALQSANTKAGVEASLPGFLPSSYTLTKTDASPGLITLNFSSPSVSEPLKIAQHRTNWDSNSLLDNFVAKHTDDYATVQGQGLTIYLFNSNTATWVNHGIWYSIEGASRLSREQILKIAYSL